MDRDFPFGIGSLVRYFTILKLFTKKNQATWWPSLSKEAQKVGILGNKWCFFRVG